MFIFFYYSRVDSNNNYFYIRYLRISLHNDTTKDVFTLPLSTMNYKIINKINKI